MSGSLRDDRLDAPSAKVLRRGFRILGVAIVEQPKVFTIAALGSAVFGLMTVASSWVLGGVTTRVILPAFATGHTRTGALVGAAAAIMAVAVIKATGIVVRRVGASVMQFNLQASYRRRVTRQYLRLPLSWHQRHSTGQLLSNANADVESAWYPIAPFPFSIGVLVMLGVAGAAMVRTDPVVALVAFVLFPAIAGMNFVYQRRLSPVATRAQELRGAVSGVAHESFDGALVVKALGREDAETERFAALAHELRDANVGVGRIRGLFDPVMEAVPNLGVLAVLVAGTARMGSGALSAGQLVQIAYLFTVLAFPVRAFGWVLAEMPRSVVGWDRVTRVLEATGSLPFGQDVLAGVGPLEVELRSVSYAYGDSVVLQDVTFGVEPGRTVAVVGPTGSGKSTLTTLLVRLADPTSGEVLFDGVDLRGVHRGGVSASAAVVPQETFLFEDTVRDNVTLGARYSDDDVWSALSLAQAADFVRALPAGLDTPLGERGATLSGGQRQRVALARALVRTPRLLVLDDATSSVDPQVEALILEGLGRAALPSTVVVVAYRASTIALADEVVYVEHGAVRDRGPHAVLRERCDGYRRLVTAYQTQPDAPPDVLTTDAEVPA